jgi:anaerobic magnesium-protoporphyrin IX monomethyl ester cyclase
MPPTAPPCGIAYLKAYIGQGHLFDGNLSYYDAAVNMVKKGTLPVEADIAGYVLEPEHLQKAAQSLKTGKDFYTPREYNRNASVFLTYMGKIDTYVREQCMTYVFEGTIDDEAFNLLECILSPVKKYHPDIVGISQLIFYQRDFTLALAKMLKEEDLSIIVGGASLSYNPGAYLSEVGQRKVDLSQVFDAAFPGEGELPLKAYVEGEDLETIPNVVHKDNILKNEKPVDIDALPPPDFGDFPLEEYYSPERVLPLLTSRGCYWMRCTFCVHYKPYQKYRARSVHKVIQDLKELQKRYSTSYFCFADEMVHPRRFKHISDSIIQEGLPLRYYADARPTADFTRELLSAMYVSGARALLWGVESGTQRILDVIDKGTTIPEIETVLKASHEAGIWNMIFFVFGYPTQTEDDILHDIAFLRRNKQYISTFAKSLFNLEVNSRIYRDPERFCITKIEENPDPFSPVCRYEVSRGLSNREAEIIYKKYMREIMGLSRVSQYFGRLRDHMMLIADHLSSDPLSEG